MICYVFLSNIVACQEEEGTVPNKRKKDGQSAVWNYFDKSADGKTAKSIKYGKTYQTSGNMTSFLFCLVFRFGTFILFFRVELYTVFYFIFN